MKYPLLSEVKLNDRVEYKSKNGLRNKVRITVTHQSQEKLSVEVCVFSLLAFYMWLDTNKHVL